VVSGGRPLPSSAEPAPASPTTSATAKPNRYRVAAWTPQQAGAFLDFASDDRLTALWHLIAYRGLRRAEAVGLSWADVDLDAASATIRDTLVQVDGSGAWGDPKSEAGARTISLDSLTVAVLRAPQGADRGPAGLGVGMGRSPVSCSPRKTARRSTPTACLSDSNVSSPGLDCRRSGCTTCATGRAGVGGGKFLRFRAGVLQLEEEQAPVELDDAELLEAYRPARRLVAPRTDGVEVGSGRVRPWLSPSRCSARPNGPTAATLSLHQGTARLPAPRRCRRPAGPVHRELMDSAPPPVAGCQLTAAREGGGAQPRSNNKPVTTSPSRSPSWVSDQHAGIARRRPGRGL